MPLLRLGGNFITKPIALPIGDFNVTEFMVVDCAGTVLFATPHEGSVLSKFVVKSLPLKFHLSKDSITALIPEVISTVDHTASDFGYASFKFNALLALKISIFGYNKVTNEFEPVSAIATVSEDKGAVYQDSLSASTQTLYYNKTASKIIITVSKEGYKSWVDSFTVNQLKKYELTPLVVNLQSLNLNTIWFKVPGITSGGVRDFTGVGFSTKSTTMLSVDWGDGQHSALTPGSDLRIALNHHYASDANHLVQVSGALDEIFDMWVYSDPKDLSKYFRFIDLDIHKATHLTNLFLYYNGAPNIMDVSNMTSLRSLVSVYGSPKYSLTNCISLDTIEIKGEIDSLDISTNVNLMYLRCSTPHLIFGNNPHLTVVELFNIENKVLENLLDNVIQYPRQGTLVFSQSFVIAGNDLLAIQQLENVYHWTLDFFP